MSRNFSEWHTFAKENIWTERMTRTVVGRFSQISTVRFRWTNYLVSSTWSQWRERHFVRKRRRMLSKRSVVLLYLRILAGFLDLWQSLRLQQRAQTRRLTQISIRWANYTKIMAVSTWRHCKQERAEEEQRQRLLQRVVMQMLNRSILRAFRSWRDQAQERAQVRAKGRKFVRRLIDRMFAAPFDAWRRHVHEKVRLRGRMKKVVLRITGDAMVGAFDKWRFYAQQLNAEQEAGERKQNLLQKVIKRMLNHLILLTFDRWCDAVDELKERKRFDRMAKNIILRCGNGSKKRAVGKWKQHTQRQRLFAIAVSRMRMKMHRVQVSRSYLSWQWQISLLKNLSSWTALLAGKRARMLLDHWLALTTKSTRTGRLVSTALEVWLRRKRSQAFDHWRDSVFELITERTNSTSALVLCETHSALGVLQTSVNQASGILFPVCKLGM
jgi:hypothetical protein